MERELSCIDCAVRRCGDSAGQYPDFCLTTHMDEEVLNEAMAFARKIGAKKPDALVTSCVTKDRVLGHNPAAALYTANFYYSKLLE